MPSSSSGPLDVCLIRLSSFGDIVLAEPVARALKQAYPRSRLVFTTRREYASLPALFSAVDLVSAYPAAGGGSQRPASRPRSPCDLAVDLQANRRSGQVVRRLKAAKVLRYRRPRLGRFFTVYLPWLWKAPQPHTIESYFRTLQPLGISYAGERPRVTPDGEVVSKVKDQVGDGPFVGICPGSSSPHKSWGEGRFGELLRRLAAERRVLIVGSGQDRAAVEAIFNETTAAGVSVYVGDDIGRIAAYLSLCQVTVTNDSGLMHLAGAVGSRPVAIFGPTSPLLGFAPAAEGAVVLSLGLDCSPCSFHGNKPCRLDRRYCMEGITPVRVASIVQRTMDES